MVNKSAVKRSLGWHLLRTMTEPIRRTTAQGVPASAKSVVAVLKKLATGTDLYDQQGT